jgi:futalosine hydrolase
MKILIVAATSLEIRPFFEKISELPFNAHSFPPVFRDGHHLSFLITGMGSTATAATLSGHLTSHQYNLVINAGIAGSFNQGLKPGDVTLVKTEIFGDLGIEESDGRFLDLFEAGLLTPGTFPFSHTKIECPTNLSGFNIPKVTGVTVNCVHGYEPSIIRIREKYHPDIETMEGAAFYYTCLLHNQRSLQVRSISNYVEKRNRENWEIPLATQNLSTALIEIIRSFPVD